MLLVVLHCDKSLRNGLIPEGLVQILGKGYKPIDWQFDPTVVLATGYHMTISPCANFVCQGNEPSRNNGENSGTYVLDFTLDSAVFCQKQNCNGINSYYLLLMNRQYNYIAVHYPEHLKSH